MVESPVENGDAGGDVEDLDPGVVRVTPIQLARDKRGSDCVTRTRQKIYSSLRR